MIRRSTWLILGVLTVLWVSELASVNGAGADSRLPPRPRDYFSADGTFRFTVIPGRLQSTQSYLLDLCTGAPVPGQALEGPFFSKGILAKKDADGRYRVVS